MKAVIPVAGNGTRIYSLGVTTPKCLIKILNKTIIEWNLESLQKNGVDEVLVILAEGEFGEKVKGFINSLDQQKSISRIKYDFTYDLDRSGTGHVLQLAKDYVKPDEKFIFLNGDDIYSEETIADLSQCDIGLLAREVENPEIWGILKVNNENNLVELIEKPKEFIGNLGNMGCYKLDSRVFSYFEKIKKSIRGEYEVTDTLTLFAKDAKLKVISTKGAWYPVGYPWEILNVTAELAKSIKSKIEGEIDPHVIIKGEVILPKSSKIKGFTYIEGNLVVGENTEIGPNVNIRGNVVLGNNVKVNFGSYIKDSVLGDDCMINNSNVGDSVFGNNVNFPRSTTTGFVPSVIIDPIEYDEGMHKEHIRSLVKSKFVDINRAKFGAVIGDNCRISVGTVIRPGVKLWPNSCTRPNEVVIADVINTWA